MKIQQLITVVSVTMLTLGCASTGEESDGSSGNFLTNLTDSFSDSSADAPDWASEPLIAENRCDTFTADNVNSFLATYNSPECARQPKMTRLARKPCIPIRLLLR